MLKTTKHKASHVLVQESETADHLKELYGKCHEMASSLRELMMAMFQKPYRLRADGLEIQVNKEDIEQILTSRFGPLDDEKRELLQTVIKGAIGLEPGFVNSGNLVPLMFAQDAPQSYYKKQSYQLLKKATEEEWSKEKLLEVVNERRDENKTSGKDSSKKYKNVEYGSFSDEEWIHFFENKDLETFGNQILSRCQSGPRAAALKLREYGLFPVKFEGFPYDRSLYNTIMHSVTQRMKGWNTASEQAAERKAERFQDFEKKKSKAIKAGGDYDLFLEFTEALHQIDYNVTKKLAITLGGRLRGSKKYQENKKKDFAPAVSLLEEPKFLPLKEKLFDLATAYLAYVKYDRTRGDSGFSDFSLEKSPFLLGFGLTGRGYPFSIDNERNSLLFTFRCPGGSVGVAGVPSRYFSNPKVTSNKTSYSLEFTRMGNGNPRFSTEVKEIGLFKKKGNLYISVNYNYAPVPISKELQETRTYFSSSLSKKCTLPENTGKVRLMGLDLGMNPAAAYTVVELNNSDGKIVCPVEGLPDTSFISSGTLGNINNKSLYNRISALANECNYGPSIMYLMKRIRDGYALNPQQEKKLQKITPRFQIRLHDDPKEQFKILRSKISSILNRFKKYSTEFALRDLPVNKGSNWESVCAEAFAMLKLLNNIRRLLKSWKRYPLHSTQQSVIAQGELASYDRRYNGLRKDTERKLCSLIVKVVLALNVKIVAVEDFELVDSDDEWKSRKDNSLRSLWSPNQLLTKLEEKLEEHGVLMARIDPRHTSQLSVITNEFGTRLPYNKEFIYFKNNDVMQRMHSDINAAMNILRRFLTRYRSFCQLKGHVLQDGSYVIHSDDSIRLQAYLNLTLGSKYGVLIPDGESYRLEKLTSQQYKKMKKESAERYEKFYRYGNQWLIRTQHFAEKEKLQNHASQIGNENIPLIEP